MILEKQTENVVFEEGESQETFKTEIDIESLQFLKQMLSKFYSDAIGSLVREVTSNALDSHREAGTKDPIIVRLQRDSQGNYEFSVEDFGIGINKETINNILKKYGKSTKRYSADQLGAYGLGWKSPIAYTSSFHFIGRKDGVETKAMMYEGEEDINIDILYEGPTTERNGVKVIVPVKFNDKYEFQRKIKEQLCYFEGVYFDCEGISNNFKIVRHDSFQWSELNVDPNLHICLDNVYYPLDFSKLGISPIKFPVSLRLSLTDGVYPVPNREQLKYTKEAKDKIMAKLAEVAKYFVEKYNEKAGDECNLNYLIAHFYSSDRAVDFYNGGIVSINPLLFYSSVKIKDPKIKDVKSISSKEIFELRDSFLYGLETSHEFVNGKIRSTDNKWSKALTLTDINSSNKPIYVYSLDFPTGNRRTYLKEEVLEKQNIRFTKFVREVKQLKLGNYKQKYIASNDNRSYYQILKLYNYKKSEWRQRIKDFQYLRSLLTVNFKDLDKVQITPEWIESRKKQRVQKMTQKGTNIRRIKLEGEITIKLSDRLERWVSGKNCKFVSRVINLKDAHRTKYLIVYGTEANEPMFQKMYEMFDITKVKFGILSEREHKKVVNNVELHNWISFEKFMKGKHIVFKRAVTAYLIDKLRSEYRSVFNSTDALSKISKDLSDKLDTLNDYTNKSYHKADEEIFKSMVKVAEENNLFDLSIYGTYKEVKSILEKLTFIEPMFSHTRSYLSDQDPMLKITKELFRFYKYKLNWENYVLPLNEEIIEELSEESLETLEEEAI